MITPQLKDLIRPLILVQRVIWIIITCSILFYSFLAFILIGTNKTSDVGMMGLEMVLYIAAVVFAASSVLYHRYSLSDAHLSMFLKRDVEVADLSRAVGAKGAEYGQLAQIESMSDFDRRALSLMYELQKVSLINLILNEMVIILGFVIAFLSGYYLKIVPFGIVSLLLCIWMFPKPESIVERACNLYTA